MSNPTHLLIPIKYIEDRIADLRKIKNKSSPEMESFYNSAISELVMLKSSKQISLSNEDIEAKASEYAFGEGSEKDFHVAELYALDSYKQALNDLLK